MKSFCLSTLCSLVLAVHGVRAVERTDTIQMSGRVITQSGQPFADAVIYLPHWLVVGQNSALDDPSVMARTDSQGNFSWLTTTTATQQSYSGDISDCAVFPIDYRKWQLSSLSCPYDPRQNSFQSEIEALRQQCTAKWTDNGKHLTLTITVPDPAYMSFLVKGPDGAPLVNRSVEVADVSSQNSGQGEILYSGYTDDHGTIQMRCFPEDLSMELVAPGVGFITTGTYTAMAGAQTTIDLPPLMRFATITGTVPPENYVSGEFVTIDSFNFAYQWYLREATVDSSRRYELTDVIPGSSSLSLHGNVPGTPRCNWLTDCLPGQSCVSDAVDDSRPPAAAQDTRSHPSSSIRGKVIDTQGKPISGAYVYAATIYYSMLGPRKQVHRTITAGDGTYKIDGLTVMDNCVTDITLVAWKPGLEPSISYVRDDGSAYIDPTTSALVADLAFGGNGGALDVHLSTPAETAEGDAVTIAPGGAAFFFAVFMNELRNSPYNDELESLLYPTAYADPNGVAHFTNIYPGIWNVVAVNSHERKDTFVAIVGERFARTKADKGIARGVAITEGHVSTLTLPIIPHMAPLQVEVRQPAGSTPAMSGIDRGPRYYWSAPDATVSNVDSTDDQLVAFQRDGLISSDVYFKDVPAPYQDLPHVPNYSASAVFVSSPCLSSLPQLTLSAEYNSGCAITVRLESDTGRPISGGLAVNAYGSLPELDLSVPETGKVTLSGLQSTTYHLQATPYGKDASLDFPEAVVQTISGQTVNIVIKGQRPQNQAAAVAASNEHTTPYRAFASGSVCLSDGRPAAGCRLAIFDQSDPEAFESDVCDATGKIGPYLSDRGLMFVGMRSTVFVKPQVVAWIPGYCGAIVAPYTPGEPITLTLPPPITLKGVVTVGGEPAPKVAHYEVRAAYQDKGNLNDILSLEMTTQADGTFILSGLTPGSYLIQASRDGVWFSPSQKVVVTNGTAIPLVTLDIPAPGGPMQFSILGRSGKPLIACLMKFDPPAGPLADLDWPKTFTTDGAGNLRFDGLSAGKHTLTVEGRTFSFQVPAYSSGQALSNLPMRL